MNKSTAAGKKMPDEVEQVCNEILSCYKSAENDDICVSFSEIIDTFKLNDVSKEFWIPAMCFLEGGGICIESDSGFENSDDSRTSNEDLSAMQAFFKDSQNGYSSKRICKEEEVELFTKFHNTTDEKEKQALLSQLTSTYIRLVAFAIKGFCKANNRNDWDDILQEGNVALIEAIQRFDISKGWRFSTYAVICIKRKVKEFTFYNDAGIGMSSHTIRRIVNIDKFATKFSNQYGRNPSVEETALHFSIKPKTVRETDMARKAYNSAKYLSHSLDCDIGTPHLGMQDRWEKGENTYPKYNYKNNMLQGENIDPMFSSFKATEPAVLDTYFEDTGEYNGDFSLSYDEFVSVIYNTFKHRELTIVVLCLGLGEDKKRYKDKEIAQMLNLTSSRVGQIRKGALEKIRILYTKGELWKVTRKIPPLYLDSKRQPFLSL